MDIIVPAGTALARAKLLGSPAARPVLTKLEPFLRLAGIGDKRTA
jgi:hypothetical protein